VSTEPGQDDVRPGVTLQINVTPGDFPYAIHTLPHQLRQWAGQVHEVVFSLETHRSKGRYGEGWEHRDSLREFLGALCTAEPKARVSVVDYSEGEHEAISSAFFGGRDVPQKDFIGYPFHGLFQGLQSARFDRVMHMDSDMMFGGGSQSWVDEATELLAERHEILFCAPLSGPPTPTGEIPGRVRARAIRWGGVIHGREPGPILGYRFGNVSSRVFLVDRARLRSELAPLRPRAPAILRGLGHRDGCRTTLRSLLRARLRGVSHFCLAEDLISEAMRKEKLVRVDYLGRDPGMWSLHPVAHSHDLYLELPRLVERVESGDLPEGQLGDFDVNDSLLEGQSIHADAEDPSMWDRTTGAVARRAKRRI
jgi:hypothetical protein